jgi:hypothetical protein
MFTCEAHGAPVRSILLGLGIVSTMFTYLHDKLASAKLISTYEAWPFLFSLRRTFSADLQSHFMFTGSLVSC